MYFPQFNIFYGYLYYGILFLNPLLFFTEIVSFFKAYVFLSFNPLLRNRSKHYFQRKKSFGKNVKKFNQHLSRKIRYPLTHVIEKENLCQPTPKIYFFGILKKGFFNLSLVQISSMEVGIWDEGYMFFTNICF